MGMYGEAAILATRFVTSGVVPCPRAGWDRAIAELSNSDSSRKKGCPRNAFLGLCEAGRIVGINARKYGVRSPNKNGQYALAAHQILESTPNLSNNPKALWAKAAPLKKENHQMEVVIALWNKGLLQNR